MGDTMAADLHRSFVVKTSSGDRWRFFLSPEQNIMYSQLDSPGETGSTDRGVLLDSQQVKDLAVTIDSGDNIHVLAFTTTGQLVYYQWNGIKWQRQTVEYLRNPAQDIPYFSILAYRDTVHIMYHIKGLLRRGTEFLIHYLGNGNKWTRQKVWTFPADSLTAIETAFVDSLGNLHMLFIQQADHQSRLLYSCYSPSFSSWSNPITVYRPDCECSDFCLYAETHHRLHILWQEKHDDSYAIKYLSLKYALQPEYDTPDAKILYSGRDQPTHPTLLLLDRLYAIWEMKGDIYCVASQDGGSSWSSPRKISGVSSGSPTFFYYTSFDIPDLPPTLGLWGIDYREVLPLSSPRALNITTAQKGEVQQSSYGHLEKRISAMEQQVENMASSIYALQEQLLQNNKAVYFLEAAIKKLNFQIEQLRSNRRQAVAYADLPQKENKPVPHREQAHQTRSVSESPVDTRSEHGTSASQLPVPPDGNGFQSSRDKRPSHSSASASPLQETQTGPKGTDDAHASTAMQSKDTPNRITLGNVDIIVNPQDEEE